ncbi:IS21 family transposase [Paenibacillus riograndensis]|uniref:Integrase catalytic subunit n=1 Tax=Paenibacillus riograndensis SBR5 TaxID=1073571 RepID=A0A0E4CZ72_9BACL|nr:IS21 family transposase [Paenibacillus riograndensis]CQR58214.1 integrase catalytic subunit [Paenibacillus riograndensis SBR5]
MRNEEYLTVQEMKQKGMSISRIAQLLGRDRKTIRRWLNGKPPDKQHHLPNLQKLDPYKDYIYQRMNEGCINAVMLLKEIRHKGYQGEATLLREYMRPLRSQIQAKGGNRREALPGEEARVDWGEITVNLHGIQTKLYLFVMTLEYSQIIYAEFMENQKLETLLNCQLHAMEYFGGVTRHVIYENLRSVSSGLDSQGRIVWNRRLIQFAGHYHFMMGFYGSRFNSSRGERGIRFVKRNFRVNEYTFTQLGEMNDKVWDWMDDMANKSVHEASAERLVDRLAREELQQINRDRFEIADHHFRKVSNDCLVSYQANHYSVPGHFAGQVVHILEQDGCIRVFHGTQEIAVHQKAFGKQQIFRQEEHSRTGRKSDSNRVK